MCCLTRSIERPKKSLDGFTFSKTDGKLHRKMNVLSSCCPTPPTIPVEEEQQRRIARVHFLCAWPHAQNTVSISQKGTLLMSVATHPIARHATGQSCDYLSSMGKADNFCRRHYRWMTH